MSCPVSRVLTHAIVMYEKCFQNKSFFFLNPLDLRVSNHWTISENPFIGQPSDIVHWTNLRYNLLDNPPVEFIGKTSDIIYWTTLRYNFLDNPPIKFVGQPSEYPFYSCTHTRFMRCTRAYVMIMLLHNISCYMHTENYMQQLCSCFISSIMLIYQA